MTLKEKVSQMLHGAAEVERLGIPSYNWWSEALHGIARAGVATMFPQAVAMAATFDAELLERVAGVIATEGRAKYHAFQREGDHDIYKGLTFWSPNINIFRDPRCGRGHETYGEDPYLTARLGVAFINGLQGDHPEMLKSAACAKHFAVHSGPEAERHEFNAVCDDYDLWNTYLPAFEAAVLEAGVEAVMGAYNRTLGEPCCGSKLLLADILRGKWGFKGHVVSDCWAVKDFHMYHKVTETPEESVTLAVRMGCDLNCGNLYPYCLDAVERGMLTEADIDLAVERLFVTRMRLGMLGAPEHPDYVSIPFEKNDCAEHRELNLEITRRAPVLLKNDGTLPLDFGKLKTVAVVGPNANSRRPLQGNYEGTASEYVTVLDGVRAMAERYGTRVMYAEGCHLYKDKVGGLAEPNDRMAEALAVARHSDAVILCLGLDADIEGEEGDAGNEFASGDKISLDLPGRQQELLERVTGAAGGKPVIVVLLSGSAIAVTWADEHVNGILQAFYPGALGGRAVAEILAGEISPEGKLPVTFYKSDADLPDFRDYGMANRTYRYFGGEALYPFGFGLTYTRFAIEAFEPGRELCRVAVRNTGSREGRETVQIYVTSPGCKEKYSLCGIAKVSLKPGGTAELEIPVAKTAFCRWDGNGDKYVVKGEHTLYAGFTQPDARSAALYGSPPLASSLNIE
ncbi:MAG: glycoside hydrolase family 3 C-terminal domain-containing protein [Oscillospiraceae bacterium]|nr:glycoside hydrolase family 3 C-terminal domain-containing protein [Oscillospiraceae bacterium]